MISATIFFKGENIQVSFYKPIPVVSIIEYTDHYQFVPSFVPTSSLEQYYDNLDKVYWFIPSSDDELHYIETTEKAAKTIHELFK